MSLIDRFSIISKTCVAAMRVVEKNRAVAIDLWIDPLVENVQRPLSRMRGRTLHHACFERMQRQGLFDSVENDAITWFFAGMICREAAVIRRKMPNLGGKEPTRTFAAIRFGKRDDFVTWGTGNAPPRQEII